MVIAILLTYFIDESPVILLIILMLNNSLAWCYEIHFKAIADPADRKADFFDNFTIMVDIICF